MPSLVAENGPQAGKKYRLEAAEIVVGRHPECDVVVDVGAVSRKHARFCRIDGRYFLEDLKSRNGTFVNDEVVNGRRKLEEADRIQICDVTFRYFDKATNAVSDDEPSSVLLEDRPGETAQVMSKVDVLSGSGSLAISATAEVKLRALIDITRDLSRTLSLQDVLPKLLDSLFQLFVQADRGFVILRDEAGKLVPRWTKLRRGDDDRLIRLSRTILNQAVDSKQAILSADAADDQRFQMSESIADFRIRSFICAPLINVEGHVLGAIQIDSLDNRNRFRQEDLELLASVAGQAAIAVDNAELHDQLVRQRVMQRDLELAQQVQRAYLPQAPPPFENFEFFDHYQPADMVGGDYYDYIALPDGRVAVVLADVVGHGMAAALQTAQLSAALRFSLATVEDPAEAITELNRKLIEGSLDDRFITLVMVVLSPGSDEVSIVNAGHMAPFLCRGDREPQEVGAEAGGMPLLVMESACYQSAKITLQDGDRLVMYTDGLNESTNAADEQYGIDRLREKIRGIRDGRELVKQLINDIQAFANGVPPKDDMCLVGCMRKL